MKKKAKKGVRPGSSIADQIKTYFKEVLELIHVDLPDEIKYKLQVAMEIEEGEAAAWESLKDVVSSGVVEQGGRHQGTNIPQILKNLDDFERGRRIELVLKAYTNHVDYVLKSKEIAVLMCASTTTVRRLQHLYRWYACCPLAIIHPGPTNTVVTLAEAKDGALFNAFAKPDECDQMLMLAGAEGPVSQHLGTAARAAVVGRGDYRRNAGSRDRTSATTVRWANQAAAMLLSTVFLLCCTPALGEHLFCCNVDWRNPVNTCVVTSHLDVDWPDFHDDCYFDVIHMTECVCSHNCGGRICNHTNTAAAYVNQYGCPPSQFHGARLVGLGTDTSFDPQCTNFQDCAKNEWADPPTTRFSDVACNRQATICNGTYTATELTSTSDRTCKDQPTFGTKHGYTACVYNNSTTPSNCALCGFGTCCCECLGRCDDNTTTVDWNNNHSCDFETHYRHTYATQNAFGRCLPKTSPTSKCQPGEYRANATWTSDRLCKNVTSCSLIQRQLAAPTATTDRRCTEKNVPSADSTIHGSTGGLSAGAIAGISIAILVVFVALGIVYVVAKKLGAKLELKHHAAEEEHAMELHEAQAETQTLFDRVSRMLAAWQIPWEHVNVTKLLAEGSFGEVWSGTYSNLNVAVKVLKKVGGPLTDDPAYASALQALDAESAEDLRKECETLQQIRHPCLLIFYGAGTRADGRSFMVTELLSLGSLRKFLRDATQDIDWSYRVKIAQDIAAGMKHLHGISIVHRDLKSDNCLLDVDFTCKVGDFGTAQLAQACAGSLSETDLGETSFGDGTAASIVTQQVGTPLWMAPEVFGGRVDRYGPAVDVYSYGIIMWELATRQEPWSELRHLPYLQFRSTLAEALLSGRRPEMPAGLGAVRPVFVRVMEGCWATDPATRPNFDTVVFSLAMADQASHSESPLVPRTSAASSSAQWPGHDLEEPLLPR